MMDDWSERSDMGTPFKFTCILSRNIIAPVEGHLSLFEYI